MRKHQRVIGVSRFSDERLKEELERVGVETIAADLLKEQELQDLPGRVATKFQNSNMVVFSSGNVYPFVPYRSGGATERTSPDPVGEYAQSCLGRERIFEHFCRRYDIPMLLFRLNYAVEMRYGNLLEIAQAVYEGNPIDLRNGHMNVIWRGDANERALRAFLHCCTPPKRLNITGPETLSVRSVVHEFGKTFGKEPQFSSEEKSTFLLNNASLSHQLFGYPSVTLNQIIEWTADWVKHDNKTIDKPTHFQVRSGKF